MKHVLKYNEYNKRVLQAWLKKKKNTYLSLLIVFFACLSIGWVQQKTDANIRQLASQSSQLASKNIRELRVVLRPEIEASSPYKS